MIFFFRTLAVNSVSDFLFVSGNQRLQFLVPSSFFYCLHRHSLPHSIHVLSHALVCYLPFYLHLLCHAPELASLKPKPPATLCSWKNGAHILGSWKNPPSRQQLSWSFYCLFLCCSELEKEHYLENLRILSSLTKSAFCCCFFNLFFRTLAVSSVSDFFFFWRELSRTALSAFLRVQTVLCVSFTSYLWRAHQTLYGSLKIGRLSQVRSVS